LVGKRKHLSHNKQLDVSKFKQTEAVTESKQVKLKVKVNVEGQCVTNGKELQYVIFNGNTTFIHNEF